MFKVCFIFWLIITAIMIFMPLYLKKRYSFYEFDDFFDDYLSPWFVYSSLVLFFSLFV